jgi:hypothetical protein
MSKLREEQISELAQKFSKIRVDATKDKWDEKIVYHESFTGYFTGYSEALKSKDEEEIPELATTGIVGWLNKRSDIISKVIQSLMSITLYAIRILSATVIIMMIYKTKNFTLDYLAALIFLCWLNLSVDLSIVKRRTK